MISSRSSSAMKASLLKSLPLVFAAFLLTAAVPASAQQLVQRGPFSKPLQVFDETGQWTIPLMVATGDDSEMYIPDVTTADWLNRNYQAFIDKGQYTISMFTLYKTPRDCRINQVSSGYSDSAHMDACLVTIRYRLRQAMVDTHLKTVTLLTAGMLDQDGQLDPASVQHETRTRTWAELDVNSQTALEKATGLITKQMRIYDLRVKASQ